MWAATTITSYNFKGFGSQQSFSCYEGLHFLLLLANSLEVLMSIDGEIRRVPMFYNR